MHCRRLDHGIVGCCMRALELWQSNTHTHTQTRKRAKRFPTHNSRTDSSSDAASHTHSARRPSAAALLTRSLGGGLTTPLAHSHTQTHTLSYGIAMPVSGLCALWCCGLACCGRHGERRCAPGAGEKTVAFCRTLVLFP